MAESLPSARPSPLLEMRGVEKSFPGVRALRGVDLDLHAGEVLALLGENGAGKSTLIKILSGAHAPDRGTVRLEGAEVRIQNPLQAQRAGIAVIYQEFNLVPGLTIRENVFLGHDRSRWGFVRRRDEREELRRLFDRIGVALDSERPCRELTVAQQQLVEVAKALALRSRILVMDEPSAALTDREVERLFGVVRDLKRQGLGVIYISHRLDEIFAVADRVTVIRDGQNVATAPIGGVGRTRLIELMVGRRIDQEFPARRVTLGEERLRVHELSGGDRVRRVSFAIRRGEVVGLAGLIGAGRTEVARLIFGADRPAFGSVELDGRHLVLRSPRDAIAAGICLLTEDRKAQGLVLGQSVQENFGLPNMKHLARFGFVRAADERERAGRYVRDLGIRVPHLRESARNLSGGNQQKLVLAKWLERNCEVVLFDEPTRGIDVGAKFEVYQLVNRLAQQGKAILLISSELPEVLGMCDRILVMRDGRLVGQRMKSDQLTQEELLHLAIDGHAE